MKKFILILIALLAFNVSNAEVKATREGKVFIQNAHHSSTGVVKSTPYTWKDSKGVEYPIMMSANGSCFVNKISSKQAKNINIILVLKLVKKFVKKWELNIKVKSQHLRTLD